ncbi:hypothetical protein BMT54_12240, partial [Pasteurellaceae bacterium 15-036681]
MFLKHFTQILNDNINGDGGGWTIIDVFGGSGLLSHTAKRIKPNARVIYNDFDGYSQRLNYINDINRLRQQLYQAVDGVVAKNKRITPELKAKLIGIINDFDGYKDLNSLASWLLFSGQQVGTLEELFEQGFW